MPVVVQKYGGTSVADVERIRKVADRIMRTKADGYDTRLAQSSVEHHVTHR